jgi:outer membrane immunogenic protein
VHELSLAWTAGAVPGTTTSGRTNDLLLITGKLGYAQDRWLAYAKAGWASAEIDLRSTTGGVTVSSSGREQGWTMGIGIDYAVTNRMLLGIAYDWAFFSLDSRTVGGAQFDGSEDIQNLTARLTFLVGGH